MPLAGGQGGFLPTRNLGVQLILFQPRETDYAHHITDCPPRLQNITASLSSLCNSDVRILSCLFFCRNLPYYPIAYTIQDKNWQQKFPKRLVQFGYKKNGISGPPRPIFGRQGRLSGGHISGVPPLFILQNPDKA